jgi:GTP pyrophosphokinase
MLLAVVKDIRVIIIKLADRLHNMKTIQFLPLEKQKLIARESLTLYAPFAHRLGLYHWRSQLEDLSFEVLYPKEYNFIKSQWEKRSESNLENLMSVEKQIKEKLKDTGIKYRELARPKNLYGIYNIKRWRDKINRLMKFKICLALELLQTLVEHCCQILSIINSNFNLVEGSFTDYINMPKANMYQSLHLSIISDTNAVVETQIRTEEMHQRAQNMELLRIGAINAMQKA